MSSIPSVGERIAGLIMGTLSGVIVGALATYSIVNDAWERDAIANGVGTYIDTDTGPQFDWIPREPKP